MTTYLQLTESPVAQRTAEKIPYWFDTSPWSDTPITPTTTVSDITSGTAVDVTSTCATGSPTIAGTVYTGPYIYTLTSGHVYRVDYQFLDGAAIFVPYLIINAED